MDHTRTTADRRPTRSRTRRVSLCLAVALLLASPAAAGTVLYVDDDAAAGGDGLGWPTAFRFLQDALAAVDPGVSEIRVGQGTYLPDRSEADPLGSGDRDASFQLASNLAVVGGYAGIGEADPDARDPDQFETILSGDLAGDDGPDFENRDENALRVVIGSGTDATARLEGVTISGGNANPIHGADTGGGMYNDDGSPTVVECVFRDNFAGSGGGGMANAGTSGPMVVRCVFEGNDAEFGGGMWNLFGGSAEIVATVFRGNTAAIGGGLQVTLASATLVDCLVAENDAAEEGGGVYLEISGSLEAISCTFAGNSAAVGGGVALADADAAISNCIVGANAGRSGADLRLQSGSTLNSSYCAIDPAGVFTDGSSSVVSLVGNISTDPLFVDPAGGDYRLDAGSPCVDAASNSLVPGAISTDLDAAPRFVDDPDTIDTGEGSCPVVDMGAYERQTGSTSCCPADVDGSGDVGFSDLLAVLSTWGPCAPECPTDLDGDGSTGFSDLLEVLSAWGPCS